ncbi:MAG: DUF523 and DUF1722 domain-containing protein [Desulfuromonadaceae bacterium]|nr:DUF523 and DUF1722 domain-containing protein [Desulfuromonadaceae bacterium]
MTTPIKIGVSACLLGEHVRYDGGHTHDHFITNTLGAYFTLLPVCPEVGCGLPVPREAMRLEGDPAAPRLMTRHTRVDKTEQMLEYCSVKIKELEREELCGFIFKKNSPSSGLYRVKVYTNGKMKKAGSGLFAAAVARRFPMMPMEEEGRLNDASNRENFIERIFCYRHWKDFLAERPTVGRLVEFHSGQKLLMMAHSPQVYRQMGVLVAHGGGIPQHELMQNYEELFMKGLAFHATVKKNTNVLQHIMGYFKKQLTNDEKAELLDIISRYRGGFLPLVVPLTLLRHYTNRYDQQYLKGQMYLAPHPAQLMLCNHV